MLEQLTDKLAPGGALIIGKLETLPEAYRRMNLGREIWGFTAKLLLLNS